MDENNAAPAVVVGGASGIGAAVADLHRAEPSTVVVLDVKQPRDVECDISDPAQIEAAVSATVDLVGVPTRVTVCAGIGHSGLLDEIGVEEWDRVVGVNARGPWLVMRAFARRMREAGGGGSIVATTSISAHLVDRNMGAYCASKAALDMVVKVAAAEWGSSGIRVNAVGPGVTDTPMLGGAPVDQGWLAKVAHRTALGEIGSAVAVAKAALALHGLDWVTGQTLDADGGLGLHSPINSYEEMLRARR